MDSMSQAEYVTADTAAQSQADLKRAFNEDIERSRQSRKTITSRWQPRKTRMYCLVVADTVMLLLAILISFLLASATSLMLPNLLAPIQIGSSGVTATVFLISFIAQLWCSWSWGHYTRFRPVWTELREILKLAIYIGGISIGLLFIITQPFSRLWLVVYIATLCIVIPIGRWIARKILIRFGLWFKSTYVVGTGDNAVSTAITLASDTAMGHRVDGFVDLSGTATHTQLLGKPVLTAVPTESPNGLNESPCVVFAFESLKEMNTYRAVFSHYIAMASFVTVSPPISGLPLYGADIVNVFRRDTVLLKLKNNINIKRAILVKRTFDVIVSSLALVLLSPIFLVLAVLISLDGGKSMYGHPRVGKNSKIFKCLKFRSMVTDSDSRLTAHLAENPSALREWEASQKLVDDPRITPIGKFIRSTSLDELPQFINVLRGDMSIVGPRPIVTDELKHYGDFLPYYLSILPGITGLWQTSGRSDTTYKERVLLDVWYTRNWCVWLDIVVILRTFPSLLKRTGAH